MSDIGNRMKENYEDRARFYLTRRTPVIIRIDGRAFHTYTRGLEKPFDQGLMRAMLDSAEFAAEQMQGFKIGYMQSDEVSFLLTDYDQLNTQAWFDYNKSKIETIAASAMTAKFNDIHDHDKIAMFDARSFNIPKEEISNYFLWRAMDWHRNSVSMYCQANFSAKQMMGKGRADQHDMLHSVGKNWTNDLSDQERNGAFFTNHGNTFDIKPTYDEINNLISDLLAEE